MSEKIMQVTDDTFENDVINAGKPVMVDFWAPWCGPCRMIAPVLEEIAEQYDGKALVAKVNTDENPGIAGALQIKSIPFVAVFIGNRVVKYTIGVQPKNIYIQMMDEALNPKEKE